MSKAVSVADAKRRFADVLGAVRHAGERFVIDASITSANRRTLVTGNPRHFKRVPGPAVEDWIRG